MPATTAHILAPALHAVRATLPLLTLGAISAWTAAACLGVSRRVRSRRAALSPSARAMLVAAAGAPLWAAAALLQPVAALQVAGAAIALVFSWEVAGVLERLVMPQR